MVTRLVTVSPDTDLLDGVRLLLRRSVTGAPVIDSDRNYLGMLSEKACITTLTEMTRELDPERSEVYAGQFMANRLVTLHPDMDAFEAIGQLLARRVSGAPVIDDDGAYLGVFSERYSMSLIIQSAYDHWPVTNVGAYMNTDRRRLVDESSNLLDAARLFLDHYYRRLPVLRDGKTVGQISRRDVLRTEYHLTKGSMLSHPVRDVMDTTASTIDEETDMLTIAQIFQTTNRRRLPVLRDGRLVGQISRRDLLADAKRLLEEAPHPAQALLYLSATLDRDDPIPVRVR